MENVPLIMKKPKLENGKESTEDVYVKMVTFLKTEIPLNVYLSLTMDVVTKLENLMKISPTGNLALFNIVKEESVKKTGSKKPNVTHKKILSVLTLFVLKD